MTNTHALTFIDAASDPRGAVPVLTAEAWLAQRADWPADRPVAVSLPNDADPQTLAVDFSRFDFIALVFPKWTDGRAYSQAHLLRSRLKYTGQLRATGEVLVDMVPLLQRTGFDAVVLKEGQSLEAAQRALGFFDGHYQRDVLIGQPVFAAKPAVAAAEAKV
jgi:uncharacterized protein (DUF934 family)